MANTITFTRAGLKEYKDLHDKAVAAKHSSFVWKASLQEIGRAARFISRLESEFAKTTSDSVTIIYVEEA